MIFFPSFSCEKLYKDHRKIFTLKIFDDRMRKIIAVSNFKLGVVIKIQPTGFVTERIKLAMKNSIKIWLIEKKGG